MYLKRIFCYLCLKFLGIYIDELLEWGYHIDYFKKKIVSCICAINSEKKCLSVENPKSL